MTDKTEWAAAISSSELVRRVRVYEQDHSPDGYPAVKMSFLTEMADLIETLLPKPRKYPRAKCPDCGQEFSLHDGKIWNHIIGQKQCPGAGKQVTPNIKAEPSRQ